MTTQAQLQAQLRSTNAAIAVLQQQLRAARPGSTTQTQLSIALYDLQQQARSITNELGAVAVANNPPNPQIPVEETLPPPPPLVGQNIAVTSNPPDPQVAAPAEPLVPVVTQENAQGEVNLVANDQVVATQQDLSAEQQRLSSIVQISNPNAANGEDYGLTTRIPTVVVEADGTETIVRNDPTAVGQEDNVQESSLLRLPEGIESRTIFNPDGTVTEVTDEGAITRDGDFIVEDGGLRRLPDDVPSTEEIEDGALVEFTLSGQRIVDENGFVITESGLRVAPEDIDEETGTTRTISTGLFEPTDYDVEQAVRAQAALDQARQQATVSQIRKQNGTAASDGDWRVRLRLAPLATYLYKSPEGAGIMEPLRATDGVIFPYTPRIDMTYSADYSPYDLTHSNYRGYFYKGSKVGEIVINADFTAQDTEEASYLLAVIHFFRSCTKMFYGQDAERGAPPPVVYLSGLGTFQFNEHPCVVSQFNYNLPNDVDYIRADGRSTSNFLASNGGFAPRLGLSNSTTQSLSLSSIISRLLGARPGGLPKGGVYTPPSQGNLGLGNPTYVPTKITMALTLLPIQSRKQVAQQFSLGNYANGNLLKGGYW